MKKIIISRTDSLGDVILTLPVAGVLKKHLPDSKIYFIGRQYTRPVIEACEHIDVFLDWDEIVGSSQFTVHSSQSADLSLRAKRSNSFQYLKNLSADVIIHVFPVKEICKAAKRANIPERIGTSHRWYNWLYCNRLVHFSRRNSDLHEAQLNLKMLEALGIKGSFSLEEITKYYGLSAPPPTPPLQGKGERGGVFSLILHPKSKGSAREWGLDNYTRLIRILPPEKFRIFITGTEEERRLMKNFLDEHESRVTDMTGKLTLSALMGLIGQCDGLVAASTGPLHIAAALGKHAIGLYAPMKPIWPKRWAPLGMNADFLCLDKKCNACRHSNDCECIRSIMPEDAASKLEAAAAKLS